MGALEGPAEIPGDGGWQRETQRTEPAVPRARPQAGNKPAPEEALSETARVIAPNFFRPLLRPARLLPGILRTAAIASPKVLFPHVPAGHGTCPAARDDAGAASCSSGANM